MRALIQRVGQASVTVDGKVVASIDRGLLAFIAVGRFDTSQDATYIAQKIVTLRLFPGNHGEFDQSISEIGAELLLVSQFTLYAQTKKGRRPNFIEAASPEVAREMFERVVKNCKDVGLAVSTGRFQAAMEVSLINDGPVTIWLDT